MQSRILTISRKPSGNLTNHPFINLSGKWLQKLGFTVGGKVLVVSEKGAIQIKTITLSHQD